MKRYWKLLKNWASRPKVHFSINLTLALLAYLGNNYYQSFCRPVPWASIVLVTTCIPFLLYPLVKKSISRFRGIYFIGLGAFAVVCIYCLIFMAEIALLAPLMLLAGGIGIFGLAPHIFLAQLLYWGIFQKRDRKTRILFLTPFLLALILFIGLGLVFKQEAVVFRENKHKSPNNYFIERIAGMHFKYHTEYCFYDGWRPPLHDPALVAALWFGLEDPLDFSLKSRVELYAQLFGAESVTCNCTCAPWNGDSKTYTTDTLFETYRSMGAP